MVMQTNLLGKLVDRGLTVALICPDKEDANLKDYCNRAGVKLCQFDRKSNFWSTQYSKTRMYFLENINKNTALLEKYKYYTEINKPIRLKTKMKYFGFKAIHDLKEIFPFIKSWYKNREEKHLESGEADQFINSLSPKILVATYPVDFREAMLLTSGKKTGIKTVLHLLSWDNISCKGHFPALADEYIAWGPIMENELKEYYNIDEAKIHTCGVPHFDLHIQTVGNPAAKVHLEGLGLNAQQPYIFFGMSSPRFAPFEIDIVEHLADQVESGTYGKEMQLVIRPHPQNIQSGMADKSWLPRLDELDTMSKVAVDFPDLTTSKLQWSMQEKDMERLSQLLAGASVSLNSGSTLSIDSMMCDTPVVLTSFDGDNKLDYWKSARRLTDYNHLSKLISYKGVPVATNYKELQQRIEMFLSDPQSLSGARKMTIQQECLGTGQSTERVVVTLEKIVLADV